MTKAATIERTVLPPEEPIGELRALLENMGSAPHTTLSGRDGRRPGRHDRPCPSAAHHPGGRGTVGHQPAHIGETARICQDRVRAPGPSPSSETRRRSCLARPGLEGTPRITRPDYQDCRPKRNVRIARNTQTHPLRHTGVLRRSSRHVRPVPSTPRIAANLPRNFRIRTTTT